VLAHGQWFSPGIPAFSTTKTGRHDIAELLLKVALQFTTQSYIHINMYLKAEKVDPAARLYIYRYVRRDSPVKQLK
jgi:hypothetical protein